MPLSERQRQYLIRNGLNPDDYEPADEPSSSAPLTANSLEQPTSKIGRGEAFTAVRNRSIVPLVTGAVAGGLMAPLTGGMSLLPAAAMIGSAGFFGGLLGSSAQEDVLRATQTPEDYKAGTDKLQAAREQYPIQSFATEVLPNFALARPSPSMLKAAVSGPSKLLFKGGGLAQNVITPLEKRALANVATGAGINTAQEAGMQLTTGEFSPGRLLAAPVVGSLFNKPWGVGRAKIFGGEGFSTGGPQSKFPQETPFSSLDFYGAERNESIGQPWLEVDDKGEWLIPDKQVDNTFREVYPKLIGENTIKPTSAAEIQNIVSLTQEQKRAILDRAQLRGQADTPTQTRFDKAPLVPLEQQNIPGIRFDEKGEIILTRQGKAIYPLALQGPEMPFTQVESPTGGSLKSAVDINLAKEPGPGTPIYSAKGVTEKPGKALHSESSELRFEPENKGPFGEGKPTYGPEESFLINEKEFEVAKRLAAKSQADIQYHQILVRRFNRAKAKWETLKDEFGGADDKTRKAFQAAQDAHDVMRQAELKIMEYLPETKRETGESEQKFNQQQSELGEPATTRIDPKTGKVIPVAGKTKLTKDIGRELSGQLKGKSPRLVDNPQVQMIGELLNRVRGVKSHRWDPTMGPEDGVGYIIPSTGEVVLNPYKANIDTILHEGIHGLFGNRKDLEILINGTKDLDALARELKTTPEEILVESAGLRSAQNILNRLNGNIRGRIRNYLQDLVSSFKAGTGLGKITEKDIVNLLARAHEISGVESLKGDDGENVSRSESSELGEGPDEGFSQSEKVKGNDEQIRLFKSGQDLTNKYLELENAATKAMEEFGPDSPEAMMAERRADRYQKMVMEAFNKLDQLNAPRGSRLNSPSSELSAGEEPQDFMSVEKEKGNKEHLRLFNRSQELDKILEKASDDFEEAKHKYGEDSYMAKRAEWVLENVQEMAGKAMGQLGQISPRSPRLNSQSSELGGDEFQNEGYNADRKLDPNSPYEGKILKHLEKLDLNYRIIQGIKEEYNRVIRIHGEESSEAKTVAELLMRLANKNKERGDKINSFFAENPRLNSPSSELTPPEDKKGKYYEGKYPLSRFFGDHDYGPKKFGDLPNVGSSIEYIYKRHRGKDANIFDDLDYWYELLDGDISDKKSVDIWIALQRAYDDFKHYTDEKTHNTETDNENLAKTSGLAKTMLEDLLNKMSDTAKFKGHMQNRMNIGPVGDRVFYTKTPHEGENKYSPSSELDKGGEQTPRRPFNPMGSLVDKYKDYFKNNPIPHFRSQEEVFTYAKNKFKDKKSFDDFLAAAELHGVVMPKEANVLQARMEKELFKSSFGQQESPAPVDERLLADIKNSKLTTNIHRQAGGTLPIIALGHLADGVPADRVHYAMERNSRNITRQEGTTVEEKQGTSTVIKNTTRPVPNLSPTIAKFIELTRGKTTIQEYLKAAKDAGIELTGSYDIEKGWNKYSASSELDQGGEANQKYEPVPGEQEILDKQLKIWMDKYQTPLSKKLNEQSSDDFASSLEGFATNLGAYGKTSNVLSKENVQAGVKKYITTNPVWKAFLKGKEINDSYYESAFNNVVFYINEKGAKSKNSDSGSGYKYFDKPIGEIRYSKIGDGRFYFSSRSPVGDKFLKDYRIPSDPNKFEMARYKTEFTAKDAGIDQVTRDPEVNTIAMNDPEIASLEKARIELRKKYGKDTIQYSKSSELDKGITKFTGQDRMIMNAYRLTDKKLKLANNIDELIEQNNLQYLNDQTKPYYKLAKDGLAQILRKSQQISLKSEAMAPLKSEGYTFGHPVAGGDEPAAKQTENFLSQLKTQLQKEKILSPPAIETIIDKFKTRDKELSVIEQSALKNVGLNPDDKTDLSAKLKGYENVFNVSQMAMDPERVAAQITLEHYQKNLEDKYGYDWRRGMLDKDESQTLQELKERLVEKGGPTRAIYFSADSELSKPWLFRAIQSNRDHIATQNPSPSGKYLSKTLKIYDRYLTDLEGRYINGAQAILQQFDPADRLWVHNSMIKDDMTGNLDNSQLSPKQVELKAALRKYLVDVQEFKNKIGLLTEGKRKGGFNPTYYPSIMSTEVAHTFAHKATSDEAKNYKKIWLDYLVKQGVTAADAQAHIRDYIDAIAGGELSSVEYSALKEQEGYGMPMELRDKNSLSTLSRYGRRVARHFAYFEILQNNPAVRRIMKMRDQNGQLDDPNTDIMIPGSQEKAESLFATTSVQDAMTFISQKFGYADSTTMGIAKVVNAALLGAGTGIGNTVVLPTVAATYMVPSQYPLFLKAFQNMMPKAREAFLAGAYRTNPNDIEFGASVNPERLTAIADKLALGLRVVQGARLIENKGRLYSYALGDLLTISNFQAAMKGDKRAIAWLEDFGKTNPDLQQYIGKSPSQVPPEVISRIAKGFVERVQGTYDASGLPLKAVDSFYAPLLSLSRWSIERANHVYNDAIVPARKGNFVPLLTYTLGAFLSGTVRNEIAKILTRKQSHTPTLKEALQTENKKEITAALISTMQLGSYLGIIGDIIQWTSEGTSGRKPRGFGFPLMDFVSDSLMDGFSNFSQAVAAGEDKGVAALHFAQKVAGDSVQNLRYLANYTWRREDINRANKYRDLRIFRELTDRREEENEPRSANDFINRPEKEFKRTPSLTRATELLPSLVRRAATKATDREDLGRRLDFLKRNSYQTFPQKGVEGAKFFEFLSKTQSKDEALTRLKDFVIQKEVNRRKSDLVPSLPTFVE